MKTLTHAYKSARGLEDKLTERYEETGIKPAVCFDKHGTCEPEKCDCWR